MYCTGCTVTFQIVILCTDFCKPIQLDVCECVCGLVFDIGEMRTECDQLNAIHSPCFVEDGWNARHGKTLSIGSRIDFDVHSHLCALVDRRLIERLEHQFVADRDIALQTSDRVRLVWEEGTDDENTSVQIIDVLYFLDLVYTQHGGTRVCEHFRTYSRSVAVRIGFNDRSQRRAFRAQSPQSIEVML